MRGAGDHFTVGERIAFYRRRRGLTQGVLAQLVGRSEDWLSKIERNERDLRRLDMLTEVARALRVSVGDLLGTPVTGGADGWRATECGFTGCSFGGLGRPRRGTRRKAPPRVTAGACGSCLAEEQHDRTNVGSDRERVKRSTGDGATLG
jgi:transcriptional regulator with XRE-family HTH domain